MVANYHTHTARCHHAQGSEREYIEKAIERGLDTLGFSDHSPYIFEGDYYSTYRMRPEETEEYVSTLAALREEYKDKIKILIGYEAEYYPKFFAKFLDHINNWEYDYIILGQHYLGNEDGPASVYPTESENILASYVDQVTEGLASKKFMYLAHPDVINYQGEDKIYRKHMSRLCERAKDLGVPFELNLLGIRGKRHYPSDRFYAVAGEVGNEIVLGCDAHWPDEIVNRASIAKALELAERHNLKIVDRLI